MAVAFDINTPIEAVFKGVGMFLAVVVSVPLITTLIKASVFFGSVTKTVDTLKESAAEASRTLTRFVDSTTDRFTEIERVQNGHGERIAVLWDGHTERRKLDRRQSEVEP